MEYKNKIIHGNALEILKQLPAEIFYTCVTSTPYWGLRDYDTIPIIWGDNNCDHEWIGYHQPPKGNQNRPDNMPNIGSNKYLQSTSLRNEGIKSSFCKKCGAWRGSYGLEPTLELYIQHTVEIFRELKRVLKKDGTLWLNLGDSYAGGNKGGNLDKFKNNHSKGLNPGNIPNGLKAKDLCGVPWRVAFALQADGWYLRQDIIWNKPNPMPESVTDRCTKSHEYIFLLSKSRKYYFDNKAIREGQQIYIRKAGGYNNHKTQMIDNYNPFKGKGGFADCDITTIGRNKHSVWTINTKPYSGAHFAVFPAELIVDCIKAGCPENEIIIDPFMGSGTTGEVALRLNRTFTGIELNKDYIKLAEKRLKPFFMPDLFRTNLKEK